MLTFLQYIFEGIFVGREKYTRFVIDCHHLFVTNIYQLSLLEDDAKVEANTTTTDITYLKESDIDLPFKKC